MRWNNSVHSDDLMDVPDLIYHDEINIRTGSGIAAPDDDGVLTCRHPTKTTDITWLRPDGTFVPNSGSGGDFLQFIHVSLRSDSFPTRSQLARAVSNPQGSVNGLWTCNAGGQPPLHVGLYARGNFI